VALHTTCVLHQVARSHAIGHGADVSECMVQSLCSAARLVITTSLVGTQYPFAPSSVYAALTGCRH
jgi:hypothetical protein